MTWNHRVIREILKDGTTWYSVKKVYYNKDGSIFAYSKGPEEVSGESRGDLRQQVKWILKCLDDPILDKNKIKLVPESSD